MKKKLKWETKLYAAAILIPALVTLLALAPFPQGIKIIGDIVFQQRADHATTPAAGTGILWVDSDSNLKYTNEDGVDATLGAAGGSAHIIQDDGTPMTAREALNFHGTGVTVTDDEMGNATDIEITAGGGGSAHVVEDEGTPLTQRANLNFVGAGVTATDDSPDTVITIPGGITALTGDVTASGTGSQAATIANDAVTNAKAANMAEGTVKGRAVGAGTGDPGDLTGSEIRAIANVEDGATADQSNAEIETAYNAQVPAASQGEMEAGTETAIRRMTPQRVAQAIAELAPGGGDPTYGSDAGADNDAVYVDENNNVGVGTTTPDASIHVYKTEAAPRLMLQYFNETGGSGDDTELAGAGSTTTVGANQWAFPSRITANDASYTVANIGGNNETTEFLVADEFGFAVPTNATILGVVAEIEAWYIENDVPDGYDDTIHIVKAGTIQTGGTDQSSATAWPGSITVRQYGADDDLWGVTLTPADVNDPGFGVAFKFIGDEDDVYNVDYISITVYYSAAPVGDHAYSTGVDLSDGAWTLRDVDTDLIRVAPATGDTVILGDLDVGGTITGDGLGTGTVTSVAVSGSDGIEIDSGSPITTTGTIALGVNRATLWTHLAGASTVTPTVSDILIIGDASDTGALKTTSVANFMLALTGSDNAIYKKDGATGQAEASGITIDDSNNMAGVGTLNGHTIPGGTNTFAMLTAAQTLTETFVQPRLDATTSDPAVINIGTDDVLTITLIQDVLVNAPSGSAADTQTVLYRIVQGATPWDVTWNSVYLASAEWDPTGVATSPSNGLIPAVSTANGAVDYYLYIRYAGASEYHLLACSQGN